MKKTRRQEPATYRPHMYRRQYWVTDCPVCGGSAWRYSNAVYCSDKCCKKLYQLRHRHPDGNNKKLQEIEDRLPAARARAEARKKVARSAAQVNAKIAQARDTSAHTRRFNVRF